MIDDTDVDTNSSDSLMLAILTGLPHLTIVQQIKKLAYHIELPSSEIVAMKCAYVNDDDVPVVFYKLPAEFRRRLIMELPLESVETFRDTVSELAGLSEGDLEDIVTESVQSLINDPVAYDWQDDVRVGRVPVDIDAFGDQVFEWRKIRPIDQFSFINEETRK